MSYLNNDISFLIDSFNVPLLHDEHQLAVLLNALGVLLALVKDAVVVALPYAHELAVVHHAAHYAAVVQLFHRRRDPETDGRRR